MTALVTAGIRTARWKLEGRFRSAGRLARLSTHPLGARIARAIKATLEGSLSAAERACVERIEALRSRLLEDDAVLSGIDYGAGSPHAPRTAEQMTRGVSWQKTVREVCRASKSRKWGLLLMKLVEEFEPVAAVELGTCLGISAAYQAAGLQVRSSSVLVTLEGSPSLASRSRQNLEALGFRNVSVVEGPFDAALDRVLEASGPLQYAYIDGHHDEQATLRYFAAMEPHLAEGCLVVFDDIRWSAGMERAWRQIYRGPNVQVVVDLFHLGLIATGRSGDKIMTRLAF
jgi:predicted O-methyltransferase YrrM